MNASTAPATLDQAQEMGLTADEFQKIQEILGRVPDKIVMLSCQKSLKKEI